MIWHWLLVLRTHWQAMFFKLRIYICGLKKALFCAMSLKLKNWSLIGENINQCIMGYWQWDDRTDAKFWVPFNNAGQQTILPVPVPSKGIEQFWCQWPCTWISVLQLESILMFKLSIWFSILAIKYEACLMRMVKIASKFIDFQQRPVRDHTQGLWG